MARRSQYEIAAMVVMLGSFVLNLQHLGHAHLSPWDEGFHAVVAEHVMAHPLTPTFIEQAYLPANPGNWGAAHVWMHKPVLPSWESAISLWLLGVSPLALRLPGAVLSSASVGITYLLGKRLFDSRAGLIAAAFQAVNALIMLQVQGYLIADLFDVSLCFYVELGMLALVWAMQGGGWRAYGWCGVATGLAILSKSTMGLIVPAVAAGMYVVGRRG